MSIFNELLPKLIEISNEITKNFNDDLKAALECFDKFEEEFKNGKSRARETQKEFYHSAVTTLQSINEDEDETIKSTEKSNSTERTSTESTERRGSKKRSKHEVDGIESPEVEKRLKRNASVKAQSIISKQVNVNLTQKMRREGSIEKSSKGRRQKEDNKENSEPVPLIQIKQEKISIPPEPMKMEQEDEIAMPPPSAPVPKPRKAVQKEKEKETEPVEEEVSRRRTTRTRKQTDSLPAQPASNRSTRASSRATKQSEEDLPPPETRPKRTRAKKVAETSTTDSEKASEENGAASPAEKPRPKRTRRVQKAAEKEKEKEVEKQQEQEKLQTEVQVKEIQPTQPVLLISPKKERISVPEPEIQSPVLQKIKKNNDKTDDEKKEKRDEKKEKRDEKKEKREKKDETKGVNQTTDINKETISKNKEEVNPNVLDKTKDINQIASESNDMDKTVVLPNGVYNHAPVTPKNVRQMNETVVLEKCNQTVVLDKPTNVIMDATVVIDKAPTGKDITEDNSLLTDDESLGHTPPKPPPVLQPTSAVKEKVQQFEEMATRVTRTKTRAMAKKDEQTENQTPPDKISKAVLSSDTLTKMNEMIFNGKTPQISSSATKLHANTNTKTMIPTSTSKLSSIRAKEEERLEKEDARRKKEALLEAKRELQKKKREDKMAAAAAAREAAERERRALLQAAARERREKQAHADMGKVERLREVERKKQELARKAAETEERRRAEEAARRQRLAEEQRRATERARQLEEAEAMKKEAAIMAREIERRQREFMEKQKMKHRMEGVVTPLKKLGHPPIEPVYMADGFQYLNSDEDEEAVERVPPSWCTSKARRKQLCIQACIPTQHIDKLFSVREHSPDLSEIFPNIEKNRLKRTSSAVWRTPPRLPTLKE